MSEAENDAQDEEDRTMTSSLLLAQQSINEELEELEDAFEADSTTNEDPQPTEPQDGGLFGSATARDPSIRRRRDRSFRLFNNEVFDQRSDDNALTGHRTSVLLNAHIYGRNALSLNSRSTVTSVADKRQSIGQSNYPCSKLGLIKWIHSLKRSIKRQSH